MAPTTNFTVQVPEGTTNHNDINLICTPATLYDVFIFFVTNYFIHAASLPAVPGESWLEIAYSVLNALFVPGFGAARTVRYFLLRPGLKHKRSPLECAIRAGALCMVVHEDVIDSFSLSHLERPDNWYWRIFHVEANPNDIIIPPTRALHGVFKLPLSNNYRLCVVPPGVPLRPVTPPRTPDQLPSPFRLSSEYNVTKVLFSLVQAVAGSITIYRARGDQIARYGYSAFGLSVVPYVFMSVANIVASFLTRDYPTMYLVRTPDMARAEQEGGEFDGVVADLDVPPGPRQTKVNTTLANEKPRPSVAIWLFLVLSPLIIVGAISGFQKGNDSTAAQRGWIISWLVIGFISGLWSLVVKKIGSQLFYDEAKGGNHLSGFPFLKSFMLIICIIPFWIPAIGGMVIVGQELHEYGICQRFN